MKKFLLTLVVPLFAISASAQDVYTVIGHKTTYSGNEAVSNTTESFLMTITPDGTFGYDFYTFAGYKIPEIGGYQGLYALADGNDAIIDFGYNYLAGNIVLASWGEEMNYDNEVIISFDGEEGVISDFTVWNVNSEGEPKELLAAWSDLSFTKGDTTAAVRTIDTDNSETVYYNLQGLKIENPSKGNTYIVKKGNTAGKIVVR